MYNFVQTLDMIDAGRGEWWMSDDDFIDKFTLDNVPDVVIEQFTDCLSDVPMVEEMLLEAMNNFLSTNNFPFKMTEIDTKANNMDMLYWRAVRC